MTKKLHSKNGSENATLKGLHKVKKKLADGSVATYFYHRGMRRKLPGTPGSQIFLQAYLAAENEFQAQTSVKPERMNSLALLIDKYKDSNEFRKLAQSTRTIMIYNLKSVEAEFGDLPIDGIHEKGVRSELLDWHNQMAKEHPRAADNKLAALARVLSWSVDRELIDKNPIASFQRAYTSDRADKIWLAEHVKAFGKVAPKELMFALFLALHTGQRQGDLLAVKWSQYDGKALTIRQGKGDNWVYVPCTAQLKAALDTTPRTATTILTNDKGEKWKNESQFRKAWLAAKSDCKEVDDLNFHDLRGTAVTMLSEAGCTTPEIAAITGHSMKGVESILARYLAKTKDLAHNAIVKLNAHKGLALTSPTL